MVTIRLPEDFKEFLQLLNANEVDYLVVGGYAVAYHGYARPSGGLNVWVRPSADNAARLVQAIAEFGFDSPEVTCDLFTHEPQNVIMGFPPFRIEIHTTLPGVDFERCWPRCRRDSLDGADVNLIALEDLKANKRAAGRPRDLEDLAHLTESASAAS
jgi:hypothetical protein